MTIYRNLAITFREVMFSAYTSERKQVTGQHDSLVVVLYSDDLGKHQHPVEMSVLFLTFHFRSWKLKTLKDKPKKRKI